MKPTLGWAGLSRSALKRAEAQLLSDSEGMRDEVGVLSLHTGYANRFFPGTSVQQSRLRYALFVPWQIRLLLQQGDKILQGQVRSTLEKAELTLAKRLPDVDGAGTIGRRTAKLGKPVAIAPSQSYWVALGAWGILHRGPFDVVPSRTELFSRWQHWPDGSRNRSLETDNENRPLYSIARLFHPRLPDPPNEFLGQGPLDFRLGAKEKEFLRLRLLDTQRAKDKMPSYLANLVRSSADIGAQQHPWNAALAKLADPADQAALQRARHAASLAAVARAVYNAMVESLQEDRDRMTVTDKHREHLRAIVAEHSQSAQRLVLYQLPIDGVLIGALADVLTTLQAWLRKGERNPLASEIYETFASWELQRKGPRRARLPKSAAARQARTEWDGEKVSRATSIEYRWSLVQRLLSDLEE
ncbi:DUF6361 family protein [uncultured Thiodictyon sp.]|uniref:DUF6361 family protein n=1 Tax=uncultured Thiodictyon sp. TaxID=1846217 RepID=UPI0025D6192F|nr:DUF6361 family protein [uncultured Thiodictyon sp.]